MKSLLDMRGSHRPYEVQHQKLLGVVLDYMSHLQLYSVKFAVSDIRSSLPQYSLYH
jgi:hypothetical protein